MYETAALLTHQNTLNSLLGQQMVDQLILTPLKGGDVKYWKRL